MCVFPHQTMGGTFVGKEQDATKGVYAQAGDTQSLYSAYTKYTCTCTCSSKWWYWLLFSVHVWLIPYPPSAVSAADVFRLNALPENSSKKLDVSASYFEIYSGKVKPYNTIELTVCACWFPSSHRLHCTSLLIAHTFLPPYLPFTQSSLPGVWSAQ